MHTERMEQLIRVLEEVQAARKPFDLRDWAYPCDAKGNLLDLDGCESDAEREALTCGTACCAIGHAGLDPWMMAQGLRLVIEDYNSTNGSETLIEAHKVEDLTRAFVISPATVVSPVYVTADGEKMHNRAVEAFFDISRPAVLWLFHPHHYKKPDINSVLARVRAFTAAGGELPPGVEQEVTTYRHDFRLTEDEIRLMTEDEVE